MYLVLMRHALAAKNLEDRHGGAGSSLTPEGRVQALHVAQSLNHRHLYPRMVFSSPVPQALETARYLSRCFGAPVSADDRLRPLGLGCIAGLSCAEAATRYPEALRSIEDWRSGRIELGELVLPEAEDYREFFARGLRFLLGVVECRHDVIVVGTRSVLILLASIILGRTILPGGGYRDIQIAPSAHLTFRRVKSGFLYMPTLSTCILDDGSRPKAGPTAALRTGSAPQPEEGMTTGFAACPRASG